MAAMAPNPVSDADFFRDKARRDLLALLEGVSKVPLLDLVLTSHVPRG